MAEDTAKKPPVTTDEVATLAKDIDIFAGWLRRLENPDPVLRTEASGKGLRLYDEVDRDAHAGSVLQQRILAVVGKEWDVIPAESARKSGRPASTTREQVVADFVSEVLENCNFDQARQELLKAILYGYYCAEVMWQSVRGAIRIKKIIGKHPRRFVFTPERELRLLTPSNMIDGEVVPDRKFIVYTYGDSDNPYGRGLGQSLWWPVWFKKNGVKFWLVFLEKFGMPTTVGKYPSGTAAPEQQKLLDAIEAIQSDTGIKIPDSMSLEFLEASRAGTVTHEQLCGFMDRQISKRVLGQTATTEGTPGKLGNEDNQGDVKQEIVEADADLFDAVMNETLIRWIVDYNFPGVAEYPKIKTFAAPKPDLKAQSEIDKTLVVDIGLPVGTAYFYETYGIPAPEEGEELVKPAPKPQPFGASGGLPQFAERRAEPDWVARYMERLGPSLQNVRTAALDSIETWLRSLPSPPPEDRFISEISGILGSTFTSIDKTAVSETVAEIYGAYRALPGMGLSLGGPDTRAVDFLAKLDNFYTSSYFKNADAQAVIKDFLKERYLEQGAGLFGRGKPEDILAFKDLFGQKLADMQGWQVERIVDTSVQRIRNWANVNQLHEGGVTEIEIYEPTQDCAFCASMNGRVISVPAAYRKMTEQAAMTEEEYVAALRDNPATLANLDSVIASGMLPPYHPHCHGRIIKRLR